MNRFMIIALFACVATCLAEPAKKLTGETETEEISSLTPKEQDYFKNFCTNNSVLVESVIEKKKISPRVIELLLETVDDFAIASSQLGSNTEQEVGNVDENTVEQVGDAAKSLEEDSVAIGVSNETGNDKVNEIVEKLKEKLISEQLQQSAAEFCRKWVKLLVSAGENKLRSHKRINPNEEFAKLHLDDVKCVTSTRVTDVADLCEMFEVLTPNVFESPAQN